MGSPVGLPSPDERLLSSLVVLLVVVVARLTLTSATVIATGTAVATGTALTLYIALGLLHEHAVRELVLTRLRIDLEELHLDVVTLLDASLLNGLEALPGYLRDVQA